MWIIEVLLVSHNSGSGSHNKAEGGMVLRKHLISLIAILLVSALVLLLTGCGSDAGKAQEYMDEGDLINAENRVKAYDMAQKMETLLGQIQADIASQKAIDPEKLKTEVDDIKRIVDELKAGGKESKATFEKIKKLKDVDDYARYADVTIDQIDLSINLLNEMEKYLNDSVSMFDQPEPDMAAWGQVSIDYANKTAEMAKAYEVLDVEAAKIKVEIDKKRV